MKNNICLSSANFYISLLRFMQYPVGDFMTDIFTFSHKKATLIPSDVYV